jgi:hypothetical protein
MQNELIEDFITISSQKKTLQKNQDGQNRFEIRNEKKNYVLSLIAVRISRKFIRKIIYISEHFTENIKNNTI